MDEKSHLINEHPPNTKYFKRLSIWFLILFFCFCIILIILLCGIIIAVFIFVGSVDNVLYHRCCVYQYFKNNITNYRTRCIDELGGCVELKKSNLVYDNLIALCGFMCHSDFGKKRCCNYNNTNKKYCLEFKGTCPYYESTTNNTLNRETIVDFCEDCYNCTK